MLDGKLIIGEVKSSIGGFDLIEIEKVAKLSRKLEPDIVVLSCLERGGDKLDNKCKEVSKKLIGMNCQVKIMSPEGLILS